MEPVINTPDLPDTKLKFTTALVDGLADEIPVVIIGGLMFHAPVIRGGDANIVPQYGVSLVESGVCLGFSPTKFSSVITLLRHLSERYRIFPDTPLEQALQLVAFRHEIKRLREFGSLKRFPVVEDGDVSNVINLPVQQVWPY